MKKLKYLGIGLGLAGLLYLTASISKPTNRLVLNPIKDLETITNNVPDLGIKYSRIKNPVIFSEEPDYLPQNNSSDQMNSNSPYGNLNIDRKQSIAEILAEDCEGNCLYLTDENGDIYKSKDPQRSFYDNFTECTGHMGGDGYVLLDPEMNVVLWGRTNSDGSNTAPEEMMEFYCDY